MDERHTKMLKDCKVMLRSTLLPEKDGIAVTRLARFYEDLVMEPFPYREFGFSSSEAFILRHMPDVARLATNKVGERVFMGVADDKTAHIANLVSKQKGKKKKPGKKPFFRPVVHRSNHSMLSRAPSSFHRPTVSGSASFPRGTVSGGPASFHRGATAGPATHSRGPVATPVGVSSYTGVKANSSWKLPSSQPYNANKSSFVSVSGYNSSSMANNVNRREIQPSVAERQDSSQNFRGLAVTIEPKNIRHVSEVRDINNRYDWGQEASLPKSDSVTVDRTTKSGRLCGPRNIFENAVQKLSQSYRPPTPPDYNTTPPDYDTPSNIEEDLRHKLERIKLQAVQSASTTAVSSKEGGGDGRAKISSNFKEWIRKMLVDKTSGLWSSYIEEQYVATFGSKLPHDFGFLSEQLADILYVESCVNIDDFLFKYSSQIVCSFGARFIVYPVQSKRKSESIFFDNLSNSSSENDLSRQHNDHSGHTGEVREQISTEPEVLKLPADSTFLVYVCHVVTPAALTVRIIGDQFSVRLEQLEEKLGSFSGYAILKHPQKDDICVALVEAEMEDGTSDISYLRAKILDITDDVATLELLDHNGLETVSVNNIFIPPPCFSSVPYQAIKCSLTGLEDLNTATELVYSAMESAVLGKTCIASVDKRSPNICLTLHETESGVNVNNDLIRSKIFLPQVPEVGDGRDCGVSYVSNEGMVYLQFFGPGLDRLLRLEKSLYDNVFTVDKQMAPSKVDVGVLYAVRASSSDAWTRALVLQHLPSNMVKVQFIDYGDTEDVRVADVRMLPSQELSILPHQAVPCVLADLPPIGAAWSEAAANFAMNLAPLSGSITTSMLVLSASTNLAPMTVSIIVDKTKVSLSEELRDQLDIWDWSRLNSKLTTEGADIQSGEDVYITWVDDPTNFRLIPLRFLDELQKLEAALQDFCSKATSIDRQQVKNVVIGDMYAVFYNGKWQRALAKPFPAKTLLPSSVLVKLIDNGSCCAVSLSDMRQLLPPFRQLPALAISVKLANVKPIDLTWTEPTRTAFSKMVLNESFTVYVVPGKWSSPTAKGPELLDHIRPVILVGQNADNGFVFVHTQLVKNGLATKVPT